MVEQNLYVLNVILHNIHLFDIKYKYLTSIT